MTACASRDVARSTRRAACSASAPGSRAASSWRCCCWRSSRRCRCPSRSRQAVTESRSASRLAARGETVQRALGGVLGDAVQESIALLTVRPESTERVALSFRVAEPRIDAEAEEQMLVLLNRARAENGLEPV